MKHLFFISFALLVFSSCEKQNLRHAEDSLVGTWKVTEIFSATGERMNNGINISDEETETGDLGTFTFTEDQLDYTFTRQGITESGNTHWTLTRTKENSGFTKVEVYTLSFEGFVFDCAFGDETSDAEKNATEVRLIFETGELGDYERFTLFLKKE